MNLPHSDADAGPTAVLIPLRSLHEGKMRLSSRYDADVRAKLIETMAHTVVMAAQDLDVLVVYDSPEVEPWAKERGARTLRPDAPGLNRAISAGRDHLRALGYGRLVVAHADLPHAVDLRLADSNTGITIVPDRHRDGTNVMSLPTAVDFTFAYGPGSFQSHMDVARRLGIEPFVVDDPQLAWDVDHPDDLAESEIIMRLAERAGSTASEHSSEPELPA
jgi:2-phospho-L-lactate guanylyltransferase